MTAHRLGYLLAFALFATCSQTIPVDTARASDTAMAAQAAEVGEPGQGRLLAERWCSSCHGTTSRGSDAAPSLPRLMRGRPNDEARLRSWLAAPHPPMRGIELSRQQTEDIVAWLRQLSRE
jgi:mono/diheme cytochrome c family protein